MAPPPSCKDLGLRRRQVVHGLQLLDLPHGMIDELGLVRVPFVRLQLFQQRRPGRLQLRDHLVGGGHPERKLARKANLDSTRKS
jgi:hypothetical protein